MNKLSGILILILTALFFGSCKDNHKNLKDGLYAEIETPKGNILLELEYEKAPITVANFVTLAEGKNPFVSEEHKGKPFYDGIVFHRVEKGFVIQGGDPFGNGTGDPGYVFRDEITDLKHNQPGTLSMANSGPNTNGSQFFITLDATPFLDGKHAVFGHVVDGMDVVNNIEANDEMTKVTIIRKGEAVKKFNALKIFNDYFKSEIENQKKQAAIDAEIEKKYNEKYEAVIAQKVAFFETLKKNAAKTPSGLRYQITQKTNGEKPKKGSTVYINYSGFLEDGTLFDTSFPAVAKQFGKYDAQRDTQHGYTSLPYEIGTNRMIPGFVEGINQMKIGEKAVFFIPSNLGYGEQGAGGVIPPNADLIFEVEVKDKM
ncbi:MAG: peptidylprolyl isomerase [Flavobacterium sp.]